MICGAEKVWKEVMVSDQLLSSEANSKKV